MLQALHEQLVTVQDQLADRSRLRRRLDAAQEQFHVAQARLHEFEAQLDREARDVHSLEALSVTGLFYTLLGTKAERLDTERRQMVAAQLRFAEAQSEVRLLEREVGELEQQMAAMFGLDARYERILEQKAQVITAANSQQAQTLFRLSSEMATAQAMLREVNEAIGAAHEVLSGLARITEALNRAGNWGVYDMLGGGSIATMIKHGHIDDARSLTAHVQHLLRRLRRELADISVQTGDVGDVSGFETFADYFFDGLISDWVVQSRIEQSAKHIQRTRQQVQRVLWSLDQKQQAVQRQVRVIKQQRRDLLETAS